MTDAATDGRATIDREEARTLLRDLVEIPSPSGEERAAAERLVTFFEAHGRRAWLDRVGNVRAPVDDALLMTSHVDTVPGEIPVRIDEGEHGPSLWGRGSVDATGALAAMAVAAVDTNVSFVGVLGEEADSRGARYLVAERDEPDAVINGEPSGWDALTLGYRGFLGGTYRTSTESAHGSRPEPNAIQDAIRWWNRVEAAFGADSEDDDAADAAAIADRVTAKPTTFDGGASDDGLAVVASVRFQLRIPTDRSADDVREVVDELTDDGAIDWDDPIPPHRSSPRTTVAQAFRAAIRAEGGNPRLLRKTGTSDANLYADAWDCPVATYGPGDSSLDHTPDERLSLREFDRSVAVLRRVARRFRGERAVTRPGGERS